MLDNCPVTVKEYLKRQFKRYVKNTGECMVPPNAKPGILNEKSANLGSLQQFYVCP